MSAESTSSKTIGKLSNGEKVILLNQLKDNWFKVKIGKETGYIHGSHLNVTYNPQKNNSTNKNNIKQVNDNSEKIKQYKNELANNKKQLVLYVSQLKQ